MVRTLAPPAALPRQKRRRARRSDPRRSPFARLTPDESRTVRALLAAGALSPDGLQRAEDVFKATGGRLEQILVNHGLVSRLVLGRVRAEEFGLDFVDLPHAIVDAALAAECDPHALIDARIFPLRRAGDVLHVATCVEPELAQDEAHRLFGPGQVSLQVTTDWDVSWAVQKHCRDRLLFDATGDLYRRQPDASAMVVVTRSQRWTGVGGLLALVLAAVAEPWALLTAVSLLVNVSFFAAVAMKSLTCVLGFFGHPGTHISDRDARAIPDRDLPRYTILVPAYHEANVVAQLVANLKALDYPVDRLEILLLLEEDDPQTLAAVKAAAPSPMVRIVVVPDGQPKTKPKACNVGLAIATGDLLVIYDAEDRPDPDQLRKAATAFANSGPEVACVQARLTYSNVRDNALTRLFTLEYDAWFQLMLPVMDRLGLPIPLGGTSNHFRIEALRRLGGWDPHNVTEDADLGIRATELGYRVLVINSNTFEEANGAYGNWIRQRSRWIKGYMQTTLVHTRHPARLLRRCGLRAGVGLAFLIAGTPLTFLLAPLLWINTLMWVVTGYTMLPTIGGWGAALSGVSLIAGNALAVLASMLAALKRRQWFLLPWALLNPLYWVMHSMAAYRGAWQLIFRPFYWEKTRHGLTKTPPAAATVAVRTAAAAS